MGVPGGSETSWTYEKGHLVWTYAGREGRDKLGNGFVQGRANSKANVSRSI